MKYLIEVHSDDPVTTGEVLENVASLVRMGATDAMGVLNDGEVMWNMVTTEYTYDHGDYRDDEGNLIHVHDDMVVHVTWAGVGAKQEEVNIDVGTWMEEHGAITPAS